MSETRPITLADMPIGPLWEDDGACWKADKCEPKVFGCEWRWHPMNWIAFEKGEPSGEMTDHPPSAALRALAGEKPIAKLGGE